MYGRCGRVSTESWSKKEEVVMVELWLREGELDVDKHAERREMRAGVLYASDASGALSARVVAWRDISWQRTRHVLDILTFTSNNAAEQQGKSFLLAAIHASSLRSLQLTHFNKLD